MFSIAILVPLALVAPLVSAVVEWGQCGGIGYSGPTECDSGLTCVHINDYYSQCQRSGTSTPSSTIIINPTPTIPAGSLDAKFKARGKKFWGAFADPNTLNLSRSTFGAVTPEYSMKWDAIEPSRGQFNYGNADTLVNWAISNGKLICGYTLVWHSQIPSWVSNIGDSAILTSVIQSHISNVAGRYRGKLYSWIVVNEAFNEDGSLRSSVFSRVLGENFITVAFVAARSADPTAKLYINDYNLDSNNAKVRGLVALVNRINSNHTLIDGIGTQIHLGAGGGSSVRATFTALAASSVAEIAITELDIAGCATSDYLAVLNACLNTPKCVSITSFITDSNSWRPPTNGSCLFDANFQPKPLLNAILAALS
uniref:Beta-xylanase n=1 Tax=Volvariella volvacea TaxID=36659 RepID=Q7Z948_9AGAR|nr:xylanase [Volvariella volvacea]